ncbi:hypothetical protein MMEU_0827 [Mycobacterium marinum str. Europe]|nr:hypothetical protein MMEU_0827 [Mycobacterium marinum str. Europe]
MAVTVATAPSAGTAGTAARAAPDTMRALPARQRRVARAVTVETGARALTAPAGPVVTAAPVAPAAAERPHRSVAGVPTEVPAVRAVPVAAASLVVSGRAARSATLASGAIRPTAKPGKAVPAEPGARGVRAATPPTDLFRTASRACPALC